VKSRFLINPDASFATSKGSSYDSIRTKLFGTPLQHRGLRIKSPLFNGKAEEQAEPRPAKLLRGNPETPRPSKIAASKHYVSKPARQRHPVEYLGYLITNEQQPDGNWIASFVHMRGAADCGQCSASHPASYMALSEAKRQIDAASPGPAGNRKYDRVPVALGGAIFATGITRECQIMDLSQGGAHLRLDKPIALEGDLHLYIKGFGRFQTQVVWNCDNEMAVRFIVDNSAVSGLLKGLANYMKGIDAAQTEERKEVRVPTSIVAVCRMAGGAAIPCEIIDASMRSMSLRIFARPRIGSLVTLGGTKVRVIRHHSKGIAVQCVSPPSP